MDDVVAGAPLIETDNGLMVTMDNPITNRAAHQQCDSDGCRY